MLAPRQSYHSRNVLVVCHIGRAIAPEHYQTLVCTQPNILFAPAMKAGKNPHLFPDTFYKAPLETWAAAIQQLPRETKQCFLDQVVHYKALSDMEHEFLVIYATHPSGSQIVLGVDRNASEDGTLATTSSESQQAPSESGSGATATATATASSSLSSSARYLGTLIARFGSQPSASDENDGSSPCPAYDGVQVSHDGTPLPILAHNGPSVALSTITFTSSHTHTSQSPTRTRAVMASASSRDPEPSRRPSLLHLSVLLLAIRTHFPSYALLHYQCYFFSRATCLSLIDLFRGTETVLEEGRRASTWRGVHVSLYSAGRAALQNMLLLPLAEFPALIVPAGLFAVYSAVKLYDGNVVENEVDRHRIRCDFIVFRATL